MKKGIKTLVIAAAVAVVGILVVFNRNSLKQQEDMTEKLQLSFVVNNEEKVCRFNENSEDFTVFDTKMRRRNGDVFDKNYGGIQLKTILETMSVNVTDSLVVNVVCADRYEIRLTGEEIITENNVWLVTQENGKELTEGNFMLVINNDEFSTRWAQNVVQVKIIEE